MTKNSLQLNENKTEVILLGPAATNNSIKTQLGFLSNNLHNHLGDHLDTLLQFDKHVNAVVKSSFFHLRSVAKVKQFLSSRKALQCRLPTAQLGWVKCREHISLLIILCVIVYVTNVFVFDCKDLEIVIQTLISSRLCQVRDGVEDSNAEEMVLLIII